MSKLPYVIFFLTLIAIAGATLFHYQTVQAVAPQVAVARQQIKSVAAEPEILPQVAPAPIASAERMRLRTTAPIESVPSTTVTKALAAQKASNKTLVQAATVLANSSQPAASPASNLKLYVQLGLTIMFIPFCLFFILSEKFNATQKNFAYTTIGTILGFWFATGA
jgi:hypothetical protein